jgi:hypothetical protein
VLLSLLILFATFGATDTPDARPSPAPTASPRPRAAVKDKAKPTRPSPAAPASPSTAASPATAGEKVYTNEDLPKEPSPAPSARPGGRGTVTVIGPEGQAPVIPEEPAGPVEPEATEQFWRERADSIRNNISTIEQQMATLQERISELRNDRGQANAMDPNREQTRQARIAEAQAEYDRAAADLERVRQTLTDLAEEARRKNIPPGWIR